MLLPGCHPALNLLCQTPYSITFKFILRQILTQIHPKTNEDRFLAWIYSEEPPSQIPTECLLPFGDSWLSLSLSSLHSQPSGLPNSYKYGPLSSAQYSNISLAHKPQTLTHCSQKNHFQTTIWATFFTAMPLLLGTSFLYYWLFSLQWQNIRQKWLRKWMVHFCLQFQGIPSIMEGRHDSWSYCIQGQEAESKECLRPACFLLPTQSWTPVHGKVPPTLKICFPTSLNIV